MLDSILTAGDIAVNKRDKKSVLVDLKLYSSLVGIISVPPS